MSKELEALNKIAYSYGYDENIKIIATALKDYENLKEENKLLRENNENLDDIYYDTWYVCERLKENSDYALMFIDDLYCLVGTKDNKFDVIDSYEINSKGIIDTDTKNKLKALEIIKEKGLDILEFRHAFSLYEYNACKSVGCEELTPEEYGLLKKVLK